MGLALAAVTGAAPAAVFQLEDWAMNLDGTVVLASDPIPTSVDVSLFDFNTGLGTVTMTVLGAGDHYAGLFVDHDIDDVGAPNPNTFFNENGSVSGAAAPGQSWEIDEPRSFQAPNGTLGLPYIGDILDNADNGTLDEMLFFDAFDNQFLVPPDDVSMAMGFAFTLAAGEVAVIDFILGTQEPAGFYLRHFDPDSLAAGDPDANIYFSGALAIIPASAVTEPGTALLLGAAGLLALRRRRR